MASGHRVNNKPSQGERGRMKPPVDGAQAMRDGFARKPPYELTGLARKKWLGDYDNQMMFGEKKP